ncbi:hypothetical protein BDP27DRAFT_1443045 [Rhodocollybia butyracea]|uniref:Uncharacterized protein n=1 Tax=Rhodocollybia butyracea TaxID=206335 RepID=A0A9P5Q8N2_9AGAR|nr:hypothetical protein BDP27DRAFT_1443045 [Rhodocollybia butyracea]
MPGSKSIRFTSPSSSPPSSPSPFPDSSPPSSPRSEPADDFTPEFLPTQHPFAGTTKQVKKPPIYEKKEKRALSNSPPTSPKETSKKVRIEEPPSLTEPESKANFDPGDVSYFPNYLTRAEDRFKDVVDSACMQCTLHINFEHEGLSYLPEDAIRDLGSIVILEGHSAFDYANPLRDTQTSAHDRFKSRLLARASSTRNISGVPRNQMCLLFADNALSRLPPQLFHLSRLTVLSLRSNKLKVLPPEICLLTSLKELNVSNNRLEYLPAEMLDMKLNALSVEPNPFIPPPASFKRTLSRSRTASKSRLFQDRPRAISSVKTIFEYGIPSLFEICFRALFSTSSFSNPISSAERYSCKLEFPYELFPDSTSDWPALVKHRLHCAIPGIVKGYSLDNHPPHKLDCVSGVGLCPSPHHYALENPGNQLFFQHVEERFTWENTIAGLENMGEIPMKWRGCQRDCLAFLDVKQVSAVTTGGGAELVSALPSDAPTQASSSVERIPEDFVQPVQLASVTFTEEDFDDE